MTEIKDWKGNIVKEGDEVCFIKILDRQYIKPAGYYIRGVYYPRNVPDEIDTKCWIVGDYEKVHLFNGELSITTIRGDITITNYLSTAIAFSDIDCWVLAIKGISDKND